MKILAFDIGIKNLAFCILDEKKVVALENCNILLPVEAIKCSKCKSKASYKINEVFCKRHIPKTHTVLKELTKKTPVKTLKELVKTHDCLKKEKKEKKDDLLESLSQKFAMPFEQPKQANASKISLEIIHDALIKFVKEKWTIFSNATHVLLENQPAYKNPHMKSVQVLLFATLREHYLKMGQKPEYHLIHAKKKVDGANIANVEKGDAGYKERKNISEERLIKYFGTTQNEIYAEWKKAKKKSDMADALCMCIDF